MHIESASLDTRSPERARQQTIDFLLWLLLVDLTIEAEPTAAAQLQTYRQQEATGPLIYSITPHTGHTDTLFSYKAVAQLTPEQLPHLTLVSAKDTWNSRWKRWLMQALVAPPYLFDRQDLSPGTVTRQINEMSQLLQPAAPDSPHRSLLIYPQGTRTPGAPVRKLPVLIAEASQAPIAVLQIEGGAQVFPKVESHQEGRQILEILRRRLERRSQQQRHAVVVKLMALLDPRTMSRTELKKKFLAAHQVASPNGTAD